jgi:hypothetical protein
MVGSYFLTQIAILNVLTGALRPFTFSCFQSFLLPCCLHLLIPCLHWSALSKGFILSRIFLCLVSSSVYKNPLSIFCSAGLVVVNSFSFSLL